MISYTFMNNIALSVSTAQVMLMRSLEKLRQDYRRDFEAYLKANQLRTTSNNAADGLLNSLRVYIASNYEDTEVMAHKDPDYGVNESFGFTIVGNDEYEKYMHDRYIEKGKIITGRDVRGLIPYPKEEVMGTTLLFRTSKGISIQSDPFIHDFIHDYIREQIPALNKAYDRDVFNYLKKFQIRVQG